MIRHEEGIELRSLQCLREGFQMAEVKVGVRPSTRIAPGAGVKADGTHEGGQVKRFLHEVDPVD